jgi:hypothetical protein
MAKYIANVTGKLKEVQPITTSAGAGDASKIIQTDSTGRIDNSLMPVGIGAEVAVGTAGEALTAGNFVNLFSGATGLGVRKADASTNAKPADGFVLNSYSNAQSGVTVYLLSQTNTAVTSLTLGSEYWLDTTPGAVTTTAPSASGNIVQLLGRATSTTSLLFESRSYYELI